MKNKKTDKNMNKDEYYRDDKIRVESYFLYSCVV